MANTRTGGSSPPKPPPTKPSKPTTKKMTANEYGAMLERRGK